jgi:hypothetical protein
LGKDGFTVKKLLAMFIVCGILATTVVGCGSSTTSGPKPAAAGEKDKKDKDK